MKLANCSAVIAFFVLLAAAEARTPQPFVVLSDIHFNPLADPAVADQLIHAEPDQWEAIFANDPHQPRQNYGDDTTWQLFGALFQMEKVAQGTKLIVLTGDVMGHKLQDKFAAATKNSDPIAYRNFARKTFAFVALELEKASGGVPVIYTIGNNDEDCGDYALQPNGPFLEDTREVVQKLAQVDAATMEKWPLLGSYATANPIVPHNRIIALNSNFWSRRYVNSCAAKTTGAFDPGEEEMKWLEGQLKEARTSGEKVWLVYHIPPGIDGHTSAKTNQATPFWKPNYAGRFYQLMDEYRSTIELSLAGHTHLDDIRLLRTEHADTLVFINPAISPNVGQNPAFRKYEVDSKGLPGDISTYYIPDLAAMTWQLEYSTRAAYSLKKLDAKSYRVIYQRIDESAELSGKCKLYYSVSRLAGLNGDKTYLRSLYCAMGNASEEAYKTCMSAKPN